MGTVHFAVIVDPNAPPTVIRNMVLITDAEGGSGDGEDGTLVGEPVPAPTLGIAALLAALSALGLVAHQQLRTRR
jgi:hypothetical protein